MCRSTHEGGRRCACTPHSRALANQNRAVARAKRRTLADRAGQFGGAALADAVIKLPPSRLSAFLIAADQVRPGTLDQLAGDMGTLPGIHNMVLEDRRERASEFGKANNSGKLDQHALAQVQEAVLEFDKARLDDGEDLSYGQRNALEHSIAVRSKALELGVLDGRTMTLERSKDLAPAQRDFYAALAPEDLPALVEVQGRVSRAFWERHLDEARFRTEARAATAGLSLHDDDGVPKTLSGLLAENPGRSVKLADDLILSRGKDGNITLTDLYNGTTVTAQGYMRGTDALARLPRVTGISLPDKASSSAQRLVDTKFLDPTTRVGANHVKTLKAGAAQAMFNSGVPVNNGEDGKASWQTHRYLSRAGLARGTVAANTPRIEGYELDGHARVSRRIKDEKLAEVAAQMGRKLTTDTETALGSPRTAPAAAYSRSGPLSPDARAAAVRGGFRARSDKGKTAPVESTAARGVPVAAFSAVSKTPPSATSLRLGLGLGVGLDTANRMVRNIANPETVSAADHVAVARLEDAFRNAKVMGSSSTPAVVNALARVPSRWNAAEDGDYLDSVFAAGSRVDTAGYVSGGLNGSAADTALNGATGPGQYKVQYLSNGHIEQGNGEAFIGHGVGFRVHSIDRTGDVPVVRLVQDDLAADIAAGNVTV
ncbi:MAG: hypothetical protein E6R04_04615 [Spirochaetes bacterium]|nr:MAG: hypothetical protein E6R04_04615 [Spirochaetota bacterium]